MNNKLKLKKGNNMNIELNTEATTDEMIAQIMPTLLEAIKQNSFTKGYRASDEQALGLVVSKFCNWNAGQILAVTSEALEDSNYDNLAESVYKLDSEYYV